MKNYHLLFFVFITLSCKTNNRLVSSQMLTGKVCLYNIEGFDDGSVYEGIVGNGSLNETVIETNKLSTAQVIEVQKILNEPRQIEAFNEKGELIRPPALPYECFYPRHGVVLYNSKDEIVKSVSICFQCNQVKVKPVQEVTNAYIIEDLRLFFEKSNIPIFTSPEEYLKYKKRLPKS